MGMTPSRGRALVVGAALVLVSGCSTTFLTGHEPMHPVSDGVWLRAWATGGVDRIELRMRRYSIDPISGVETPDTPMMLVKTCNPAGWVSSARCSYRAPYAGNAKMLEFEGTVVRWNGTSSTEMYKFAMGRYPFPGKPVPIRVKGPTIEMLDVVIVPDDDLVNSIYASASNPDGGWTSFRIFLDEIVERNFFDYRAIRHWRGLYNFYYSPVTAHFNEATCAFTDPSNLADLQVVADSLMYVHSREMWDCSKDDRFSTENWYDKSIVHETGHSLFGLRDEYNGANFGAYPPQACMSNIFASKSDCEDAAAEMNISPSLCTLVNSTWNIWRIDPADAAGCIMGPAQHNRWSDFGRADMRRINWRYDKCLSGDCMAIDECD